MIDWQRLSVKGEYYAAELERADQIDGALRSMWRKICNAVLPAHEPSEWNLLKVEIWADSGRLIAFPAVDAQTRNDRGGCELVVQPLLSFWERLADSDESDESFERQVYDHLRVIADQAIAAFEVELLVECRRVAADRNRVTVACYNAASTSGLAERTFAVASPER